MSQGNQDLFFHLVFNEALPATARPSVYVALQRRHPDGVRWVEVARFLRRADAQAARRSVVQGGHARADEIRVHSVRRER